MEEKVENLSEIGQRVLQEDPRKDMKFNVPTYKTRIKRGFTLIELLVVMVVIAVLALIVVPQFASRTTQAREANLRSNLKSIRTAIQTFRADTGAWPADLSKLSSDVVSGWQGPYITAPMPQDPTAAAAAGNNSNWSYTAASGGLVSATSAYATW